MLPVIQRMMANSRFDEMNGYGYDYEEFRIMRERYQFDPIARIALALVSMGIGVAIVQFGMNIVFIIKSPIGIVYKLVKAADVRAAAVLNTAESQRLVAAAQRDQAVVNPMALADRLARAPADNLARQNREAIAAANAGGDRGIVNYAGGAPNPLEQMMNMIQMQMAAQMARNMRRNSERAEERERARGPALPPPPVARNALVPVEESAEVLRARLAALEAREARNTEARMERNRAAVPRERAEGKEAEGGRRRRMRRSKTSKKHSMKKKMTRKH